MRDEVKTILSKRLPAFMALCGHSARTVANRACINTTTLSAIMRGVSTPHAEHAFRLAKALNIKVSELVGR